MVCGRSPTKVDEYQVVGKVDYQLSDKESLFGRYVATAYLRPPAYSLAPDNLLTSQQGGLDDLAQSVILGDTYLTGATAHRRKSAACTPPTAGISST